MCVCRRLSHFSLAMAHESFHLAIERRRPPAPPNDDSQWQRKSSDMTWSAQWPSIWLRVENNGLCQTFEYERTHMYDADGQIERYFQPCACLLHYKNSKIVLNADWIYSEHRIPHDSRTVRERERESPSSFCTFLPRRQEFPFDVWRDFNEIRVSSANIA